MLETAMPIEAFPPGMDIKPFYTTCPRCGLDLEEFYQAERDQHQGQHIDGDSSGCRAARITAADSDPRNDALLQRMIDPLTKTEKERAQGNEQASLNGQSRQQPGCKQQKDREADGHQHLVPMIQRQFLKWIAHARKFITRS